MFDIFLAVLLTKLCVNKFIKAILKECKYCKKLLKKYFNKNLVMTVEDERSLNQVINAGCVVDCLLKGIIK